MKTLPDNPNLDHLRRQAKDLLGGLRESRPETSLAEAQAQIAEQYGFHTWTALKAHVDRVQGGGEVAGESLAREIAARFGLGRVTAPMRSAARADDMGRRWWLETDRGRWAVRTMDTWRRIVDQEDDFALQEAAAQAGILLPRPVRSPSGRVVEQIGGHTWRAYEAVHSGPPLVPPVSSAIMYEAGAVLATIHGLALPVDRISPHLRPMQSQADWLDLTATARASRAAWAVGLAVALPTFFDLGTIGDGVVPPPPVLTHNVLGPNNVRLGEDGRLIVVGWEHAGGQPPSWELSNALMHWAGGLGDRPSASGAGAMLDGYRSVAGSLPELNLASFRGAVISWLNFVFGEAQGALNADQAEDRGHFERSLRGLLVGVPTRPRLQRLLEAALVSARA